MNLPGVHEGANESGKKLPCSDGQGANEALGLPDAFAALKHGGGSSQRDEFYHAGQRFRFNSLE